MHQCLYRGIDAPDDCRPQKVDCRFLQVEFAEFYKSTVFRRQKQVACYECKNEVEHVQLRRQVDVCRSLARQCGQVFCATRTYLKLKFAVVYTLSEERRHLEPTIGLYRILRVDRLFLQLACYFYKLSSTGDMDKSTCGQCGRGLTGQQWLFQCD